MRTLLSNKQAAAINLFEAFQEALRDLHANDAYLLSKPRTKGAISHKLAMYMEEHLREKKISYEGLFFDVMLDHADIVLHDRKGKVYVTIMVFHDYIPRTEIALLKKTMVEGAVLTLAVALLSGKDYLLIYRVGRETIDYYHYNLSENLSSLKMSKDRLERYDKEQLTLIRTPRRRRRKNR